MSRRCQIFKNKKPHMNVPCAFSFIDALFRLQQHVLSLKPATIWIIQCPEAL